MQVDVARVTSIEGTIDDASVRPDGALVTPGAIDRAIGPAPHAYQVVEVSPTELEVEVVGSPAEVEAVLAPLFVGMRVTARKVTAIGVEPIGKYRTTRRRSSDIALSALFESCDGA